MTLKNTLFLEGNRTARVSEGKDHESRVLESLQKNQDHRFKDFSIKGKKRQNKIGL